MIPPQYEKHLDRIYQSLRFALRRGTQDGQDWFQSIRKKPLKQAGAFGAGVRPCARS
jgi:hypothetical protein